MTTRQKHTPTVTEGIDVRDWVWSSVSVMHLLGWSGVVDLQSAAGALRAARARQPVARLDFLRGLRGVTRSGLATQSAITRELGISQSAVSRNLQEEAKVALVLEGFMVLNRRRSFRGSLPVTDRMSKSSMSLRWPYSPSDELDGPMDDLLVTVRGSFDDVEDAAVSGVLPAEVYGEIRVRLREQNETSSRWRLLLPRSTSAPELRTRSVGGEVRMRP